MGWATPYIADLKAGITVSFRPKGNSMQPKIRSGQLCTVAPLSGEDLQPGMIVLCRVKGSDYLHLISKTKGEGHSRQFLISNNRGRDNGWVGLSGIYGVLTHLCD